MPAEPGGERRVINIGSEVGVAIVPGRAAYCVGKHALRALTEVIQDANHDNGIKAWIICPGFVDTDIGDVVPGTNPLNFLRVSEVVDMARYLIRLDYNVQLGPEILIRTMRTRGQPDPAVISGQAIRRSVPVAASAQARFPVASTACQSAGDGGGL